MIFFNKNALRNKLQHFKQKTKDFVSNKFDKQKEDVETQNAKADMASEMSFPASDPPGFISKSSEDKTMHQ